MTKWKNKVQSNIYYNTHFIFMWQLEEESSILTLLGCSSYFNICNLNMQQLTAEPLSHFRFRLGLRIVLIIQRGNMALKSNSLFWWMRREADVQSLQSDSSTVCEVSNPQHTVGPLHHPPRWSLSWATTAQTEALLPPRGQTQHWFNRVWLKWKQSQAFTTRMVSFMFF